MGRPLSLHLYIYAENDPVDKLDPTGQAMYVAVRPLDVTGGGLLKIAANHVYLAFISGATRTTFSSHPEGVCSGTSLSILVLVTPPTEPCIAYNDQNDLYSLNKTGIGYAKYLVTSDPEKEARLLDFALELRLRINSGGSRQLYCVGVQNCGGWVEEVLHHEGLSMPKKLINLGVGTTFRFGLAPNWGVNVSYRFDTLRDLIFFWL